MKFDMAELIVAFGLLALGLGLFIVNVKLNSATSKDGEKNGKTYTVYTIFDENGEKYGTFDTNDTGAIVAIKYVEIYNEATIGSGRRAA